MADTLLRETTSLCGTCKRSLSAQIVHADTQVVMRKHCPDHGASEVLISSDAGWYDKVMSYSPTLQPPTTSKPVSQGCPFDCGPCKSHEQNIQLPIVPITSACNLDCPICYTHNKNAGAWHMSEVELRSVLEHLRLAAPEKRIINITGGEPTQHPAFERLIEMCHEEGIHRITISTHGMRFLKEEKLLAKLASLDARVVLSFDSFNAKTNRDMLGGDFLGPKMRVLDLLEKHGVNTSLLPVLARGVNDHELGQFIDLALSKDFIRSVEFHTMTFTGQGGASFDRQGRYTTYDVLADIELHSAGRLRVDDFVPSPAAHSLCYLVTYLLRLDDNSWIPFPRFMTWQDFRSMLAGSLYMEPGPTMEHHLADVINRLWVGELTCENADAVLAALKRLSQEIFDPNISEAQRLRVAERNTKAIYVHAHMDEETFDTDRVRQCPVGIREPNGANIPSCSYNVLYRERDHRFMKQPESPLVTLGKGRVAL
jgi:7,8-dihydro-6-hydroxymethylpterin dimethyltransferase